MTADDLLLSELVNGVVARSGEALRVAEHQSGTALDACLSPVAFDERNDPTGPNTSRNGDRWSDKGFLAMSKSEYL